MKVLLLITLSIATISCSSSSDNPENNENHLLGTWLSNCHEFLGTEDEAGNNLYSISKITFTSSAYVDNYVTYTDINCNADAVEESSAYSYTVGDMVPTTDGVSATRITLTFIFPDRPESSMVVDEAIYRISGVELNFGRYNDDEIPTIDTRLTYIKQNE